MSASIQEVIEHATNTLVGPAGLIGRLETILSGPGEPRMYTVSSITANLQNISPTWIPGSQGASGFTAEEATIGAIGETIERYCAACYDWDDLTYASQTELGPQAIGMDRFSLYTDDIYQQKNCFLTRWRPDLKMYWARGESMLTGETRYLPAEMIYTPFLLDNPKKAPMVATGVSSGQACHTDRSQALLSGICEAIERDAFMITWMRRIPPTRINLEEDAFLKSIYSRYFECPSVNFELYSIGLDLPVPVVLCVGRGVTEQKGPFINVGAAARVSERDACLKALTEGSQGTAWVRELVRSRSTWRPAPDFSNLMSFEDHLYTYCFPEHISRADFILKTPKSRGVLPDSPASKSPEKALQFCVDTLAERGLEPIAVDLTTPEMADLGFYVPKVIVPGLAHLTAVHDMPALAVPRYSEVPARLGLTDPIHAQWNSDPHPFP
jgi:ribosomal protein S12 methylthiotransferase accessory factor